jgi:hypothetical protein
MLRGHNAVIHTTPKWACQRIKRKKRCRRMGATTHSIEKFPSSSGNRAQWSVRYTWVYGTENITGSLHLNNIFSNVRPGHRFVTNNRRMSVLKRENPENEWGESVPSNGVQYGQIIAGAFIVTGDELCLRIWCQTTSGWRSFEVAAWHAATITIP